MSQGCAIFRTWVIWQNVQLKIIDFSMETPYWCTALVQGGRKPVETSEIYFGYLKHFLLCDELANIRIHISLCILAVQTSKTQGESMFSCMWHVSQQPSSSARIMKNSEIQTALFSKQSTVPSWTHIIKLLMTSRATQELKPTRMIFFSQWHRHTRKKKIRVLPTGVEPMTFRLLTYF